MGNVLVNEAYLYGIANALREKYGTDKKYLPSEMADEVRGIQSGGNTELMNYITYCASMFYYTVFPEDYELELFFPNLRPSSSAYNLSYMFQGAKGVKKIKFILNHLNLIENSINVAYFAQSCEDLIEIDFEGIEIKTTTSCAFAFYNCKKLKSINCTFNLENATNLGQIFGASELLEEVRFKERSIKVSIGLTTPLLSNTSIQSIIDGLADLTGGAAQTLTLHADVKTKLTEVQISQITSKNWTLA